MMLSKRVIAVAGWDNRCPIESDVSAQLQEALSNGVYVCNAVTITRLVQATMTNPNGGSNEIAIEMLVPSSEQDSDLVAYITLAILGLSLPTAPTITVTSVTIF